MRCVLVEIGGARWFGRRIDDAIPGTASSSPTRDDRFIPTGGCPSRFRSLDSINSQRSNEENPHGNEMRRRRPIARLATGAAVAGIAYHMGKRYEQQSQMNDQAQAGLRRDPAGAPARRRPRPSSSTPGPSRPAPAGGANGRPRPAGAVPQLRRAHRRGVLGRQGQAARHLDRHPHRFAHHPSAVHRSRSTPCLPQPRRPSSSRRSKPPSTGSTRPARGDLHRGRRRLVPEPRRQLARRARRGVRRPHDVLSNIVISFDAIYIVGDNAIAEWRIGADHTGAAGHRGGAATSSRADGASCSPARRSPSSAATRSVRSATTSTTPRCWSSCSSTD